MYAPTGEVDADSPMLYGAAAGTWSHARRRPDIQSEDYPGRIHGTALSRVGRAVGLEVLASSSCLVRVALLCLSPARRQPSTRRRLALLRLVLPAFRVAATAHFGGEQRAPQSQTRHLAGVLDAVEGPLAVYDPKGRLLYANAAAERLIRLEDADSTLRRAMDRVANAIDRSTPRAYQHRPLELVECVRGSLVRGRAIADQPPLPDTPAVVVSVTPAGDYLPSPEELKVRHGLTAREVDVAWMLLRRKTASEIAEALRLSIYTVRHHIEHVLMKLGVHSRTALADAIATRRHRSGEATTGGSLLPKQHQTDSRS